MSSHSLDARHVSFSEHCAPVLLSGWVMLAPPRDGITDVVRLRSGLKVRRIATRSIVAPVAHNTRAVAAGKAEGDSMRELPWLILPSEAPIPTRASVALPLPTLVGSAPVDTQPKFRDGFSAHGSSPARGYH